MTVQHTYHSRARAAQRKITDQMIRLTLNKLNLMNLTGHKAYIIDRTQDYTLVVNIYNNRISIITLMTDKGTINIIGRNSVIKFVD